MLLDESVPKALRYRLPGHLVETVNSQGWLGIKNGSLLKLIEQTGFEALTTADKNMRYQQQMERYPFAILLLSTNHWPTLRGKIQAVRDALIIAAPGQVTKVDCGVFLPAKRRNKTKE